MSTIVSGTESNMPTGPISHPQNISDIKTTSVDNPNPRPRNFGSIIDPKILGRGLGLSTLVVFVSLIFWGWLMGPVGMLLSVPLTIVLKIALEPTAAGHKIAVLLGDGPLKR